MLIDSHAHIIDERLDTAQIIADMDRDNLGAIVVAGCDIISSKQAAELSEDNDGIYFTAGCHPEDCAEYKDGDYKSYLDLTKHGKCVAVGEVGLDYHYEDGADKDVQKYVFERMLNLANDSRLPAVLHIRDAYKDSLDILKANSSLLSNGFVMHCYGGSKELVKDYCDLGAYFSLGGVVTFRNAKKDDIIRAIPQDRLLLETDCPYMTPEPFRGKVNRPAYVAYTARKIADVLGVDYAKLCDITFENTLRIFNKINCAKKAR